MTREKNSTGKACPETDGKVSEKVCGQSQSVSCCTKGNWENVGDVLSTGKQKQERTVVGCDPITTPKVREIDACYMSDWVDQGCVGTDGKRKETRTVKGTRCGYGTKNERFIEDLINCCKQKGTWGDSTASGSNGKKNQAQSTEGKCSSSVKTRSVDCEYIGGWKNSGDCGSDGKQKYTRSTVNSNATTKKSDNCCFIGEWGGWTPSGDCDGSKRTHSRARTVLNCPSGTKTTESQQRNCNDCEGKWVDEGVRNKYNRRVKGFRTSRTYYDRIKTYTYKITKPAKNGGKSCPHKEGETKEENIGQCRVGGNNLLVMPHC